MLIIEILWFKIISPLKMIINDCAIIATTIFDNGWLEKISMKL